MRFVVSAEGRVTENRYGTASVGYGLLTHTLQYIGQVYNLTGLSPAAPLTEAQLTAWLAGLQDKTQVQLTEYGYDLRGNMSQQTSYGAVSATGTGVLDGQASVTEYIYDAHSQLCRRIVVRVLLWGTTVLAVLAIFAVWANRELLSPNNWSDTSTKLLQNATVRVMKAKTRSMGFRMPWRRTGTQMIRFTTDEMNPIFHQSRSDR